MGASFWEILSAKDEYNASASVPTSMFRIPANRDSSLNKVSMSSGISNESTISSNLANFLRNWTDSGYTVS